MKIAIVCANNGLPINGETTFATHLYKFAKSMGHDPVVIIAGKTIKPKKYDFRPSSKMLHSRVHYKDLDVTGFDKVILMSVPYKDEDSSKLVLSRIDSGYTIIFHGHTAIKTMQYDLFAKNAGRIVTNDAILVDQYCADSIVTPFFFKEHYFCGKNTSHKILVPPRVSFAKSPKETSDFIAKHSDYTFKLAGNSSGDTGFVMHNFFKDLTNIELVEYSDDNSREQVFLGNKYAMDLSRHTKGGGNIKNYSLLETMHYGVVPIFFGDCIDSEIHGIDISKEYSLDMSDEEYFAIVSKNYAVLKGDYGSKKNVEVILK